MGTHEGMTEAERHKAEWIEERAGILEHDAGYRPEVALAMARTMWRGYANERGLPDPL